MILRFQSSKTGGPVAAAWAVMNAMGDDGYMEAMRATLAGTKALERGIQDISGIELVVHTDANLVVFCSEAAEGEPGHVNMFLLANLMSKRGWCG